MTPRDEALYDPVAILAGIGLADRTALATFLALLQEAGSMALIKGAAQGLWGKAKVAIGKPDSADHVESEALAAVRMEILQSSARDDELRHRLWKALVTALGVDGPTPLSPRSARQSASALAIRAAENLSPSIHKARQAAKSKEAAAEPDSDLESTDWIADLGKGLRGKAEQAKALFAPSPPLPFRDIVAAEFLSILRDPEIAKAVAEAAFEDKEMAEAFGRAQAAAQAAMIGAGGWAAFAAIVANAGFAPYMLAAQAAGWLPLVGGKALVSLLAVLVSPAALIVGIGAAAWLGTAKAQDFVSTAVASRISILLAISASDRSEMGLALFLNSMRALAGSAKSKMAHLSPEDQEKFRARADFLTERLGRIPNDVAGVPPEPWNLRARPLVARQDAADAAAVAGLTAAELYWNAAAINPNVIAAADFSRSANLGDPLSFALAAQDFVSEGAAVSLRGYTAERLVVDHFVALGHCVALSPLSNTPGQDLVLDGMPFQVKCGKNLALLKEHFSTYPDIPVIANLELAQQAWDNASNWADQVTTFPGFEIARIGAEVSEALGHAASILDPDVPEFALSIGLLRGGLAVWRGKIPLEDLPAWLVMDGAARGALAFAGGKIGWLAGLVAVGPAGAVVLGPTVACAALIGTSPLKDKAAQAVMGEWHGKLFSIAAVLHQEIAFALERRIQELAGRSARIHGRTSVTRTDYGSWLDRRADDDLVSAIEELADLGPPPLKEDAVLNLVTKAAMIAPWSVNVARARKGVERHMAARPRLGTAAVEAGKKLLNRRPT